MTATASHDTGARTGLFLGLGAYTMWGLLPLYLRLLREVPAMQVLGHRVLWSLLLLGVIVLVLGRGRAIVAAARGRTLLLLCASAALIAVNWYIYIWAIQSAHVLEASLGYFINPLVNVALGMAVLGERITRVQTAAIAVAGTGVAVMAVAGGGAIWVPLLLAVTFSLYGLVRKVVAVDALGGLAIETMLLAPPALAVILYAGDAGVFGRDMRIDLLLVGAGVATALPLLLFAAAARRLRYSTLGLIQYIAPTLAFLQAVLLFGEPLRLVHLVTFALIWTGCAMYAWSSLRTPVPPL
ncbi:MAG TPA: EamA family transporter RarD [Sphingomonas sp.]|jgi:chloramphenicol-sensitive protein RarD